MIEQPKCSRCGIDIDHHSDVGTDKCGWCECDDRNAQRRENQKAQPGSLNPVVGMLRRLQCRLGLCGGHIQHERDANGVWWVGLKCTATGKLHNPIKSAYQDKHPNAKLRDAGESGVEQH